MSKKKKRKLRYQEREGLKRRFIKRIKNLSLILIILFLLFFIGVSFNFLKKYPFFPVKKVNLFITQQRLDQSTLKASILKNLQGNFFTANLKKLAEVLESNPWIKRATIDRKWPASVTIHITEYQPIAIWNGEALITKKGKIFVPPKNQFPLSLVKLNGPKGMESNLLSYLENFNKANTLNNVCIQSLTLSQDGLWSLQLDNNIAVILGYKKVKERFDTFMQLYTKIIGKNCVQEVERVDLRYAHGVAIKWKNGKQCHPLQKEKRE